MLIIPSFILAIEDESDRDLMEQVIDIRID